MAELLFSSSSNVIVKREPYRDEKPYTGKRIVQNLKVEWEPNPAWNPNAVISQPTVGTASVSQAVAMGKAQTKGTATATWTVPFTDYDFVKITWKGSKDNGKTWYNIYTPDTPVYSKRWQQVNLTSSYTADPFKNVIQIHDNIQYIKCEATPVSVGGGSRYIALERSLKSVSLS